MREYKRRNFVVNKSLQFGIIAVFLTAVLIASLAAMAVSVFILVSSGKISADTFIDTFLLPILINDLLIMTAVALTGIFYSNRIAGPLYQMKAVIEEHISGQPGRRIRVRPNDYGADLAEKINLLLDKNEK